MVPVGLSTVVLWVAALAAAVGAASQVLQDRAPWLAVVAAVLVAANNALRSWQAVRAPGGDG